MSQQNRLLRDCLLSVGGRQVRRSLLGGIAIVSLFCLVACTPPVDKTSGTNSSDASARTLDRSSRVESSSVPEIYESTDGKARDRSSLTGEDKSSWTIIGPRPDRNPPLPDCGNLNAQSAMNACAQKNYQAVDAELNQAYRLLIDGLPEGGQAALETAETAWIDFRDLDCGFERSQFEGGSVAPLIYYNCLEARTTARTDELYEPATIQTSYAAVDGELNAVYQTLMGVLSAPRQEDSAGAQLAWIEYRDRQCEFETAYGPGEISLDQCKARLSEKRTRQLQAAIEQNSL